MERKESYFGSLHEKDDNNAILGAIQQRRGGNKPIIVMHKLCIQSIFPPAAPVRDGEG